MVTNLTVYKTIPVCQGAVGPRGPKGWQGLGQMGMGLTDKRMALFV